jgi:hypothetical protein
MAERETYEALHNDSLTSKANATGAVPGGPPHARKATPTTTLMAPRRRALQSLIAVIKNPRRRIPSQQN